MAPLSLLYHRKHVPTVQNLPQNISVSRCSPLNELNVNRRSTNIHWELGGFVASFDTPLPESHILMWTLSCSSEIRVGKRFGIISLHKLDFIKYYRLFIYAQFSSAQPGHPISQNNELWNENKTNLGMLPIYECYDVAENVLWVTVRT
ncbi:hypothetical protein JTB14_004018 [Gonioctena quinquepunctata]|nr:hypothetical protein JTB14_004018 [Gonioctena quinquepunctata]